MLRVQSGTVVLESVAYGFFGRKNGKSAGHYASLNCSKFVGDDDALVFKNLEIVREEFQSRVLITLNQIHSNLCITVDQQTKPHIKADAMVTRIPNVAIGILTADCAPILFLDGKKQIIGAAHAGWRGAVSGIIEATVQKMVELGADPENVVAVIGPCIQKESYEIDDAFKANFSEDNCFHSINHRTHFDLPKYCRNRLIKFGLAADNIDAIAIDTYADPENYFSYRFATKNTAGICGRNVSVICLK
ncbi:MAG: peptidoglycan editing factor PgeF [Holosporaceae bacterium]|nr:peptidoglycan editing factor PgeF [Holosporaceae bacterium]